jgi:probable F420-dependent oxidoreductase
MKIGINTFLTDEGISGPVLGRALEERGFESLFVAEHSHIPVSRRTPYPGGGDLPRMYYRAYDPFVALAAIASVTDRLILGTGVTLLIQRDVIHTANEVATLDRVSGGRVVFGVGVGWNREERENHGTDPRTRGALVDEQLAALRAIWTQDEAEFHGEFIDFDPIYAWPKPIQKPHPPIFLGGGPSAAERAIKHGIGWIPLTAPTPAAISDQLAVFRDSGLPINAMAVGAPNPAILDAYAEAGVERVTLTLDTIPEAESLRELDTLATFVDKYAA